MNTRKLRSVLLLNAQVEKDERSETEPDSESEDEKHILHGDGEQQHAANGTVPGLLSW